MNEKLQHYFCGKTYKFIIVLKNDCYYKRLLMIKLFTKLARFSFGIFICSHAFAQANKTASAIILNINAAKVVANVSPTLYGIMTEEINHSYDGGLYAELIRNRIFKDDVRKPTFWSVASNNADSTLISLNNTQPINDSLTVCLQLNAAKASPANAIGIANEGFWGIPVKPSTKYTASFYAKTDAKVSEPMTVSLVGNDGKVYATAQVSGINTGWKKYSVTLTTGADVNPSVSNRFVISVQQPGKYWFNLVSLFPPTYNNRPNGNRVDLMQKLADLNPKFLRFPGGNYVEGNSMAEFYNWKKTIHDLSVRPGHMGTWKYRSSDGIGLLEFLEWTEDLHIQPVLAVFAGYTLNKEYVAAGPELQKYVDDALDEIEYVTGSAKTKWGAQRVADGHPAPFPLTYVEIGNEDFFDRSGSYDGRYAQFYDAIKAKYPNLQLMATTKVKSRKPDIIDDHFYRRPADFEKDTHHYDTFSRSGPKIFVGEWASRPSQNRTATPDMSCALGDASWMTGMERNSDHVILAGYAPLLVNVNPGAMQWPIDMIGYDAISSYGSPSYYAQQMFYTNIGNGVLASDVSGIPEIKVPPAPVRQAPPATTTGKEATKQTAPATTPAPPPDTYMPSMSYVVTRDSKSGIIYLKVVNILGQSQAVTINLQGVKSVSPTATAITLAGKPEDTNSITDPTKVIPVTSKVNGVKTGFIYTFLPNSITVLKMQSKL